MTDPPSEPRTTERDDCAIEVELGLLEKAELDILTPLAIHNAHRGHQERESVLFVIDIKECPSSRTTITVANGTTVLHREVHTKDYLSVGSHHWPWDGYDDHGILDTRILKSPTLNVTVAVEHAGRTATATLDLHNKPEEVDWVDVRVDRNARHVDVEVRVELVDGWAKDLGHPFPPQATAGTPAGAPGAGAMPTQLRTFTQLETQACAGVGHYWSRDAGNGLNVGMGPGPYTVTVAAVNRTRDAMDDLDVDYNTNGPWGRSSNPGTVHNVVSFFAQLVPERIIYNVEWLEYETTAGGKVWDYQAPADADQEFAETAAHEIGHEILSSFADVRYSYTHKGSSTYVTQAVIPVADGGFAYPASGEIDLMRYYNGTRPAGWRARVHAAEDDVRDLVWLARVDFDD